MIPGFHYDYDDHPYDDEEVRLMAKGEHLKHMLFDGGRRRVDGVTYDVSRYFDADLEYGVVRLELRFGGGMWDLAAYASERTLHAFTAIEFIQLYASLGAGTWVLISEDRTRDPVAVYGFERADREALEALGRVVARAREALALADLTPPSRG